MTALKNTIYIVNDNFSLSQTFECGQCFRFEPLSPEFYHGVAFGREIYMSLESGRLTLSCDEDEFQAIWRGYLDLDRDYAEIRRLISIDDRTAEAVEYGAGIRILHQEPWEALCSFIISQCNNIPRIRGIISRLCAFYGEQIGKNVYTFPDAGRIAQSSVSELMSVLRCGYRAPYILEAARAAADGRLDFNKLYNLPTQEAKTVLTSLPGVGEKVASCMLLFGLGKLDAFPVDVWMRRAIDTLYGKGFNPQTSFGEYAGIAQQYIFYHTRSNRIHK